MANAKKPSTATKIENLEELRKSASLANAFLLGVCNAKTAEEVSEYGLKLKDLVVEIIKYKANEVK